MVFPYITGKNFAFRILVEFAAVLWLGLMVLNKEYRLRNTTLVFFILLFTFVVGLADLLGVNPYKSFWSNYERMEGYITILHLVLYFMIVKSILKTKKDWKIFFNIFLLVSVFVSLLSLIEPMVTTKSGRYLIEYGNRIASTIGNPPFLASYLLLSTFLGFILLVNTEKRYLKYVYLLPIGLNSTVIYLTASRGAILAAIFGLIIFILFYIFKKIHTPKEKFLKIVAISILVIFVILPIIFWVFRDTDFIQRDKTLSRFTTMFSDTSFKNRITAWKMGLRGFKERPILGWGQENFIGVYTVNPIPFEEGWRFLDRAHNIIIEWLINAGILGLFSYLMIFGSAFYILWKAFQKKTISRNESIAIFIALAVYFVHNLFTFDTINTYLIFFALLAYIDNLIPCNSPLEKGKNEININSKKLNIKFITVTILTLLSFIFVCYLINYKPIKKSKLIAHMSISFPKYNSYLTLFDDFEKTLSYKTFDDNIVRGMMLAVSRQIIRFKLFTKEGALDFIQKTVEELDRGITPNRYNLRYLTNVIYFYNLLASTEPPFIAPEKVEALIKECININPKYQTLYMLLADVYFIKKDYERAYINVKKVVDKDPKNDYKQLKLALVAILTSREDVVKKALENVEKIRRESNKNIASGKEPVLSLEELNLIAQTYMKIKDYHRALQYYKKIIKRLPTGLETEFENFPKPKESVLAVYHFEIAKIYKYLGEKENAIKEAKKALQIDPVNFTQKVNEFINSF
jgi:O-antigen ligase